MAGANPSNEIIKPSTPAELTLEAWSQGFMVGALIIMAGITVSNMRQGVLLHKLILIELIFAIPNGFFIFLDPPMYGWYLSSTAVFVILSWSMHNFIAWIKNKPFLRRRASLIYIGTVILAQPYWVLEIYANFAYFNNINNLFHYTRPLEALFRDPWWIFTSINLFWNIKYRYDFSLIELVRVSPRFGILLLSMCLSVGFIIVDICSVTAVLAIGLADGINPFWKFAFMFKCFTDTIVLDDFKTALDKLHQYKLARMRGNTFGGTSSGHQTQWVGSERRRTVFAPCNERIGVTSAENLEGIHVEVEMSLSTAGGARSSQSAGSSCEIMGAVHAKDKRQNAR